MMLLYNINIMSPRPKANLIALRVSDDMLAQMQALQERDGIPLSEQVRRALAEWLPSRGIKSDRKQAATRKRS